STRTTRCPTSGTALPRRGGGSRQTSASRPPSFNLQYKSEPGRDPRIGRGSRPVRPQLVAASARAGSDIKLILHPLSEGLVVIAPGLPRDERHAGGLLVHLLHPDTNRGGILETAVDS